MRNELRLKKCMKSETLIMRGCNQFTQIHLLAFHAAHVPIEIMKSTLITWIAHDSKAKLKISKILSPFRFASAFI